MKVIDEVVKGGFIYDDGKLYHAHYKSPRAKAGDLAGTVNVHGYILVRVDGKQIPAHRLIYEHFNGKIDDGKVIDHIDHNTTNNKIENLRQCSHKENLMNRSGAASQSHTGIRNVQKLPSGNYYVSLYIEGKHKSFGTHEEIELAEFVAQEARKKYFGEFA